MFEVLAGDAAAMPQARTTRRAGAAGFCLPNREPTKNMFFSRVFPHILQKTRVFHDFTSGCSSFFHAVVLSQGHLAAPIDRLQQPDQVVLETAGRTSPNHRRCLRHEWVDQWSPDEFKKRIGSQEDGDFLRKPRTIGVVAFCCASYFRGHPLGPTLQRSPGPGEECASHGVADPRCGSPACDTVQCWTPTVAWWFKHGFGSQKRYPVVPRAFLFDP